MKKPVPIDIGITAEPCVIDAREVCEFRFVIEGPHGAPILDADAAHLFLTARTIGKSEFRVRLAPGSKIQIAP